MSDINFLDNKKHDHDQRPKDKDDKNDRLVWSDPKKEAKSFKNSAFSFLPFLNKKESANKSNASINNKNKIKEPREEILHLIKHHENLKVPPKEKSRGFLRVLGEKLKKQPGLKEILIDYQRVYNQEKELKNQVGKIFNSKPVAESRQAPPSVGKSKNDWFKGLIRSFKSKIMAFYAHKNQMSKIIKLPKAEESKPAVVRQPAPPITSFEKKSAEVHPVKSGSAGARDEQFNGVKEMPVGEKSSIQRDEIKQRVLETNLIQGELVTFFDWRSKSIILVSAILTPIFAVVAIYYGLVLYQKSNQTENLAQAERFAELEKNIAEEESGINQVYDFQTRLKIISQIFGQHLYWTNFFKFLEENTIKDVYFINFDGDTSGDYTMDALATNYNSIAEQVNVFRNNNKVISVEASGGERVSWDDSNRFLVKFSLNFSVSKSIFTE